MKTRRYLLGPTLAMLLSSCCLHRINLDEFYKSPLDRQITAYEAAYSEGCIYSEKAALLQSISRNGYPAAEAMIEHLNHPRESFPAEDAIAVIEFVHFGGADLRKHEALSTLVHIAATSPDANIREEAEQTIKKIRSNDPLAGTRPGPDLERDKKRSDKIPPQRRYQ